MAELERLLRLAKTSRRLSGEATDSQIASALCALADEYELRAAHLAGSGHSDRKRSGEGRGAAPS